jgi:cysteinyl-tRNA synthetase
VGQPDAAAVASAVLPDAFAEAMDDDLAVPRALAIIHETVTDGNGALASSDAKAAAAALLSVRAMLNVLGLDPQAAPWSGHAGGAPLSALDALVRAEIDARAAAREAKDWATADAIRDRLAAAGITLEDGQEAVRWSITGER